MGFPERVTIQSHTITTVARIRRNNCLTWLGQFTKLRFRRVLCVEHNTHNYMRDTKMISEK
jgi:hypothetical protein